MNISKLWAAVAGVVIAGVLFLVIAYAGGEFLFRGEDSLPAETLMAQIEQTVVARLAAESQQTQAAAEQQAVATSLSAQLTQVAQDQQAVATTLAGLNAMLTQQALAPVVVDPNNSIQPVALVADPNSDKPQLSVLLQANVRTGPGITCKAVSALLKDSVAPVLAKNRDGTWLEIGLSDGKTGWIATSVTNATGADISSYSVATNPPVCPPPVTATATMTPTTVAAKTATLTPTTAGPTQLEKTSWQVDFAYNGGSRRLQVLFTQNGGVLSGSNRDNNAEVDIVTSGTVRGNTVVITFTLSNGGSPRGSVTCTGTIGGSPQTISGSFTATDGFGATSGNCTFR